MPASRIGAETLLKEGNRQAKPACSLRLVAVLPEFCNAVTA